MTESSPGGGQRAVYEDVRGQIDRGELCPGDLVPSERALEAKHGVARLTARRALEALADDGVITTIAGRRGRYVREYKPLEWVLSDLEQAPRLDNPEEGYDDWAARIRLTGRTPRQEVDVWYGDAGKAPDAPRVAELLQLDPKDDVVARHRLRLIDEVPWQLSTSYFPWWLTEVPGGEVLRTKGDVVMPGGFLASIGHPMSDDLDDEIIPRVPTRKETELLHLPDKGSAVAEHVRIGWPADGGPKPLRVVFTIAPGDRNKLIYRGRRR